MSISLGLTIMAIVGLLHAKKREERRLRRERIAETDSGIDIYSVQVTGPWQVNLHNLTFAA